MGLLQGQQLLSTTVISPTPYCEMLLKILTRILTQPGSTNNIQYTKCNTNVCASTAVSQLSPTTAITIRTFNAIQSAPPLGLQGKASGQLANESSFGNPLPINNSLLFKNMTVSGVLTFLNKCQKTALMTRALIK